MKTLFKSPGIFLLEKGDRYSRSSRILSQGHEEHGYISYWHEDEPTKIETIKAVPFSELTEEQARQLFPALENWDEKLTALQLLRTKVNTLLRQKNEPELRQGERPKHPLDGQYNGKEEFTEIVLSIEQYDNATKLSDILIES